MQYNTIEEIERLTEKDAQKIASETAIIKGFNCYFVDFGGYFGFSICVFKNAHYIYYANDYALHHRGKTVEELKEIYRKQLESKLFTDEEIAAPLSDYEEFLRRQYFLQNYYPMQVDHVSIFGNFNDEKFAAEWEKKTEKMYYNPVGLCYTNDPEFNARNYELFAALMAREKELKDSAEYWRAAFLYEMRNHEYGINWQADFDVLSAFGRLEWRGESETELEDYFGQLQFAETQRRAYMAARREYFAHYDC